MNIAGNALVRTERAIAEFRSGRLMRIGGLDGHILATNAEMLTEETAMLLDRVAQGAARLILSPFRLARLGHARSEPGAIILSRIDTVEIARLAYAYPEAGKIEIEPTTQAERASLELSQLAELLPAAIALPIPDDFPQGCLIDIPALDVFDYRRRAAAAMRIVTRLRQNDLEFVVFRGGEGFREQVAVIVGQPDIFEAVMVRLHSTCLTGDLFGSLKCDCGDQLRSTIARMRTGAGGIVLYLDQEGRGIGIGEKIRAYRLQADGLDTYEADEILGFAPDRRRFDFAAGMLNRLGIRRVRLLTNNPVKIAALTEAGIDVATSERIIGRPSNASARYIAAKRDKAGHMFSL